MRADPVEMEWRKDMGKRHREYVQWLHSECWDELRPLADFYLERASLVRQDLEAFWALHTMFGKQGRIEDRVVMFHLFRPKDAEKEINRLETLAKTYSQPKQPIDTSKVTEIEIERARNFPITSLLNVKKGSRINCIFHEDKNPSMLVNDYYVYCFVCCGHADSIDYLMKTEGIGFAVAVKRLSR